MTHALARTLFAVMALTKTRSPLEEHLKMARDLKAQAKGKKK